MACVCVYDILTFFRSLSDSCLLFPFSQRPSSSQEEMYVFNNSAVSNDSLKFSRSSPRIPFSSTPERTRLRDELQRRAGHWKFTSSDLRWVPPQKQKSPIDEDEQSEEEKRPHILFSRQKDVRHKHRLSSSREAFLKTEADTSSSGAVTDSKDQQQRSGYLQSVVSPKIQGRIPMRDLRDEKDKGSRARAKTPT